MDTRQQRNRRVANRIRLVMEHTSRYSFKGRSRLAEDTGFSDSAITRLLNGRCTPTYDIAHAVTRALERELGQHIPTRELITFSGTYPTASVCDLIGCRGCPQRTVFTVRQATIPSFQDGQPGQWPLDLPTASARQAATESEDRE